MKQAPFYCAAIFAAATAGASAGTLFPRPQPAPLLQQPVFANSAIITNPYLPMPAGTTFTYDGHKGKLAEHDVIEVSTRTKNIIGINCAIEVDSVYLDKQIVELTYDYFAQDAYGNVWYFGEFATQYKNGKPNGHAGSWVSGERGAQPGIVMEAIPRVGDVYNQENAPPTAEDKARVLSVTASVETPYGTYIGNVLETNDFSPLDPPHSNEHKYYEPGIGFMKSEDVKKGPQSEVIALTSIT